MGSLGHGVVEIASPPRFRNRPKAQRLTEEHRDLRYLWACNKANFDWTQVRGSLL